MARQGELERELAQMRGSAFENANLDVVGAGTTVTYAAGDGRLRSFTVLGEWDSDESLAIISNRSRLAEALEGLKVGEVASVPSADGEEAATITSIEPLSAEIREWIGKP